MKFKLKKYYEFLFSLLMFFLPLEGEFRAVPNIILIALTPLFFLTLKKADLKAFKNKTFLLLLFFLAYTILNLFLNDSLLSNLFIVKKLVIIFILYILYIPLNIGNKIKVSFILGAMLSILISCWSIALYIMEVGEFSFSVGDIVGEVLLTERVYLALVAVISYVFSLDLITHSTKRNRILLIINISIIVLFILLISARMALLSILLIGLYNLLFLKKFKLLVIGSILGGLFLALTFILNDNLQNRFFYKNKESSFVENFKKWEPRVEIWHCVFVLNSENTISNKWFGYGSFKTTQEKLVSCYSESVQELTKKKWFLKIQYNTHNQFFDIFLALGLFGVVLFLIPILRLIYKCRGNRINMSLIIAFLLVFLVENCLHRQIGVYLFGLLLIVISGSLKEIKMSDGIHE